MEQILYHFYNKGVRKVVIHMKHPIKLILVLLTITMLSALFVTKDIIYEGYSMYRTAVREESIDMKIEELRNNPNYIQLDDVSDEFLKRLVKSEDRRFRYHFGVDPIAIVRATFNNVMAGYYKEGGSTITQQLAKNMYFSFEKKMERKIAEVFVAVELEKKLTKNEILELYINEIYFGEDCYGIKEASAHYYEATPDELTNDQIDALVQTIKAPTFYNPNVYSLN